MSQPASENFLNKYKNLNSWSKYNTTGGNTAQSSYYSSDQHFERNPDLAHDVLNKAGPQHIYHRPGYDHEVSNVARVTTEFSHQPSSVNTVYKINEDSDPVRIVKPIDAVTHRQTVRVRYLEPPNLPTPAPIVIKERQLTPPPPAPPIVVRQRAKTPPTPPPLIIREKPPVAPEIATQTTYIEKLIPPPTPPPRQVIVERIPAPEKPRNIIYEKWLPYNQPPERQVIVERGRMYEKAQAPKNLIIEYEKPSVNIETLVYDDGVLRGVDPNSYYTSRVDGSELRLVDRIIDLPLPNQSRSYASTNQLSYQPTMQQVSTSVTELRPRSVKPIARGPPGSYGPYNTTYRTSYTSRGFPLYK